MHNKFNELLNSLQKHSISEYPKEACGIITKDFTYIPTRNISKHPKISFVIDPFAIMEHENNIWGFYHSHPGSSDPIPSKNDIASTIFSEYKFLVGFAKNTYIYWLENKNLRFEVFNENHCTLL
jgi:proteasome lid subunit RPN8/RPN11